MDHVTNCQSARQVFVCQWRGTPQWFSRLTTSLAGLATKWTTMDEEWKVQIPVDGEVPSMYHLPIRHPVPHFDIQQLLPRLRFTSDGKVQSHVGDICCRVIEMS